MTSGNFETVLIDSITVDREGRQRRELRNIEELATSIREVGLIHPPVITRDGQLVAGERRLTACLSLGWTSIPVQYADDLDPLQLHLLELEENVKREDLTWQEHTLAVEEYHALRRQQDPEWSVTRTAEALGISRPSASQHITVAKALADPMVKSAPKFSTALGIVTRRAERSKRDTSREIDLGMTTTVASATGRKPEEVQPAEPSRAASLFNADFSKWAPKYDGPPFNFLHCDFPYGINADKHNQGSAAGFGGYADSADVYYNLINSLIENQARLCDPQCHMMFWFSMTYYSETVALLEGAGWKVARYPLIWHRSDNKGILPDPQRGPRQVYETALLCTLGDRKVVRAVSNLCASHTTKEFHMSEKPAAMLEHFFRMLVDDSTEMLDPTAGSGMSVKVAEAAGAKRAVGLEINLDFYTAACDNLNLQA